MFPFNAQMPKVYLYLTVVLLLGIAAMVLLLNDHPWAGLGFIMLNLLLALYGGRRRHKYLSLESARIYSDNYLLTLLMTPD